MTIDLSPEDRAMLDGAAGPGTALAMRVLLRWAETAGAEHLLDITGAHIDGCLYHGRAGLDFALRLAEGGAHARVPTTLNVSSLDLLHPELYRGDADRAAAARALMDAYVEMGCLPTWTCAPYQLPRRPGLGEHVAWAESNAIVFANSVLGARTDRYGDFIDICAAVTGRAPAAGLHLDRHRAGGILFLLDGLPVRLLDSDVLFPVLGHLVGKLAGTAVPVIEGDLAATEDRLKALGAAAASSGAVAMFHLVGATPEAPDRRTALGGKTVPEVRVGPALLAEARDELSTLSGGQLDAVSLGTPHYSAEELERLARLFAGRRARVPVYVNTARHVLAEAAGPAEALAAAGCVLVTDTCTYVTPILDPACRRVMTDSGKWAYYAPGNLGVDVVFGSMEECVESAAAGEVRRDDALWG